MVGAVEAGFKIKEFESREERAVGEQILVFQFWDRSLGESSSLWRQMPRVTYGLRFGENEEVGGTVRQSFNHSEIKEAQEWETK